jgi:hypothetical protein
MGDSRFFSDGPQAALSGSSSSVPSSPATSGEPDSDRNEAPDMDWRDVGDRVAGVLDAAMPPPRSRAGQVGRECGEVIGTGLRKLIEWVIERPYAPCEHPRSWSAEEASDPEDHGFEPLGSSSEESESQRSGR